MLRGMRRGMLGCYGLCRLGEELAIGGTYRHWCGFLYNQKICQRL
jgi:hypothetical protein